MPPSPLLPFNPGCECAHQDHLYPNLTQTTPPQHPIRGLQFLKGHINEIVNRSKKRRSANKGRPWVPPSLVRCLSSFGSITTCAHGHAIKRSPQHLRLSHFGIVNTPNMHDNLFRPYVAIMTGSCDNLHMKYSSMSAGTPAYRAGSTAIFEPNMDVRGEITLKLFKAQESFWGRLLVDLPRAERLKRRGAPTAGLKTVCSTRRPLAHLWGRLVSDGCRARRSYNPRGYAATWT